jgi:cytochrome c peroxidase
MKAHVSLAAIAATMALAGSTAVSQTLSVFVALPATVAAPADNPTTPEKVALGRLLFWDPILSGHRDVSCATCHHPDFGYAEPLDLSIGTGGVGLGATRTFAPGHPARLVKRNSLTILNAGFNGIGPNSSYDPANAPMFWDSRVNSLEVQALEPIKALEEMRGDAYAEDRVVAEVVARLAANAEYRTLFARAFGPRNAVSADNLGRAMAAFQRSLVATNAPFDRYMRGDTAAMTPQQLRGMNRFQSTGCSNCHSGPMFSDFKTHVLAVPDNGKLATSDSGINGTYAFRTASLRNLAYTAPYMHNGVFDDLDDVVDFYQRISRGGRGGRNGGGRGVNANVTRDQIDPLARQLNMRGGGGGGRGGGGRNSDLIAFLGALNDDGFDRTIPERVPSGLKVGGN